ncbi:uncharacterized protein LOC135846875 [Planococcus citri]|uniref:uncharacterized protein LOC135846875 n=1 Tax=Planococcus citri TaxID=170843 RepID=UPI0031F9C3E6
MSQAAADILKLDREKRLIVKTINVEQSSIVKKLEETPSVTVVNEMMESLGAWKEQMALLRAINLKLLDCYDQILDKDPAAAKEEEFMLAMSKLQSEFSSCAGKIKTMNDVVNEPQSRPRSSFMNASFLEATLTNPTIKLQDIPVPHFDGDIENFPDWFAEFSDMIDANPDFTNFQKMYLLKRCMIGDAEILLKDYEKDPNMYPEALDYIKTSFNNRRRIISNHFAKLVDLQPIKPATLRDSLNQIQRIIRGLSVCGLDTAKMSPLFAFLISRKLPEKLRVDWENSVHDYSTYPSVEPLVKFLTNRCFAFESVAPKPNGSTAPESSKNTTKLSVSNESPKKQTKKSFVSAKENNIQSTKPKFKCVACSDAHYLTQCVIFLEKSVTDRFELVKAHKLCIRCFSPFHTVTACTKKFVCSMCKGQHHSLLHRDQTSEKSSGSGSTGTPGGTGPTPNQGGTNTSFGGISTSQKAVVLSTAVVQVINIRGKTHLARILFDQGSQTSLVTLDFVKRANLGTFENQTPTVLVGVNSDSSTLNESSKFLLKSRFNNFQISVEAEVIGKIPCQVSRHKILTDITSHFGNLNFAENYNLPYGSVDIILGAEYVEFILESERKFIEDLCLRDSKFGYVILGSFRTTNLAISATYCGLSNIKLNEQFKQFCNVEQISDLNESKNDNILEHDLFDKHFEETYRRDDTGSFVLRLPSKPSISILKGSFGKGKTMLLKSERKKSEALQIAYRDFMKEYENMGHMTKLDPSSAILNDSNNYVIPHHMVTKTSSTTTKYRVVFNASCKDESGTSLNDHLLSGLVYQPELFSVTVTYRQYPIAFSADIAHMYRQILINEIDRKYQLILFRYDMSEPISVFTGNTLTYGTGPASNMATKCLEKVGDSIASTHPIESESIKKEFYMDNYMSGADDVDKALARQKIVHDTLLSFGMPLRKYASNSQEFLSKLEPSLIEPLKTRVLGGDSYIYVLGLVWCPQSDTLNVMLNFELLPSIITKRVILSDVSKIFDLLGMLSPVTITAKIILQDLWREGKEWDEPVSQELSDRFRTYRESLINLSKISIPRFYYGCKNSEIKQIIGFCDASTKAYCAVLYLRSVDSEGQVTVTFICAKTRVAPLKSVQNIHHLELLAALLLSELVYRICRDLKFDQQNVFYFSDSQVTLHWINHQVDQLKQYVSNRVIKINKLSNKVQWYYIDTKNNPADLATRGISVQNLIEGTTWISGPRLLTKDVILEKLKLNVDIEKIEPLSVEEKKESYNRLIRAAQFEFYSSEFENLSNGKPIPKRSTLFTLDVFLDADKIIRVGGRISASRFSYDIKHPIILSHKSSLTELIVNHAHRGLSSLIKKVLRKCTLCTRIHASAVEQFMADLPKERTSVSRPFTYTGVDLSGAFNVKCLIAYLRAILYHHLIDSYIDVVYL